MVLTVTLLMFVLQAGAASDPDVCAQRPPHPSCGLSGDDALSAGIALLDSQRYAEAVPYFRSARAAGGGLAAALLEGICQYELGDDARAAPLLQSARAKPDLRDSAELFLGLVELRQGRPASAASHFDSASQSADSSLASSAADLRRVARADGRVIASVSALAGVDSNIALRPDSPRLGGDAMAHVTGSVLGRLNPRTGPYLRATATWRDQLTLSAYDLGGASAALGFERSGELLTASVEYGYEGFVLGGAPFLAAHEFAARARLVFDGLTISGGYSGRLESYASFASGYSGQMHRGDLAGRWRFGSRVVVQLGARVERAAVADPSLAYLGAAPELRTDVRIFGGVRLRGSASLLGRFYDAPATPGGLVRQDAVMEARGALLIPIADRWSVEVLAGHARSSSNVDLFSWANTFGSAGISWEWGSGG